MCERRNVLWVESDTVYARTLARSLRVHAKPDVDLRVRFARDLATARRALPKADVLIANPAIGRGCSNLFARWSEDRDKPAIALAAHFTLGECIELQRLKALVLTKDGAFAEARELATLITEGMPAAPRRSRRPRANAFDAVLSEVAASGAKYAAFLAALDARAIRDALERAGSVKRAAEWLGMSRSTLGSKMRKLGLAASAP